MVYPLRRGGLNGRKVHYMNNQVRQTEGGAEIQLEALVVDGVDGKGGPLETTFDTRTINMPILQRSAISGAQSDGPMVTERILVDVVTAHYYHLGDLVGG